MSYGSYSGHFRSLETSSKYSAYQSVGVASDMNSRYRRTMEDMHCVVHDFCEKKGDGFFAVYDGHAGKMVADYSSERLHIILKDEINSSKSKSVTECLDSTFKKLDLEVANKSFKSGGCTVALALLRREVRDLPTEDQAHVGVLYTANVGDARVVKCRRGKAVRLSYDHKATDRLESYRIVQAGGLIINHRVNGVLAVTRSIGDTYMKAYITGHPYTTESIITDADEFIIIACDGLWDVCTDQKAVDIVRNINDSELASQALIDYALKNFTTDNITCMTIRL